MSHPDCLNSSNDRGLIASWGTLALCRTNLIIPSKKVLQILAKSSYAFCSFTAFVYSLLPPRFPQFFLFFIFLHVTCILIFWSISVHTRGWSIAFFFPLRVRRHFKSLGKKDFNYRIKYIVFLFWWTLPHGTLTILISYWLKWKLICAGFLVPKPWEDIEDSFIIDDKSEV